MSDEQITDSSGLKPAPIEQGGERKFWIGVRVYCFNEAWALLFGSGVLWYAGLVQNRVLLFGLASAATTVFVLGSRIETWLQIMSGEPMLNDRGEDASVAPIERGIRYIFPPLVAAFGIIGTVVNMPLISILTSLGSLAIFGLLMRRILTIWRNRCVEVY